MTAWIWFAVAVVSLPLIDAATPPSSSARYPLIVDSNCTCFRTNISTSNYFSHHSFFDFRSMSKYAHTPPVLADAQSSTNAPPVNDFFKSVNWTSMWQAQTWDNGSMMRQNNSDVIGSDATLFVVNSPNSIYIEHNNGSGSAPGSIYMVMRTARLNSFQTSTEIESSSNGYQFLSLRVYARTLGASGAITAIFTYRPGTNNNSNTVQGSDLKIRTRDPPTRVQFTNQPSWNTDGDIPQATRNVTMPGTGRWIEWAHYRMDWAPGSTTWYVDSQLASTSTIQAPRDPSQVMFNSWSDGGTWSGNMSTNAAAYRFSGSRWCSTAPTPCTCLDPGRARTCAISTRHR